VCEVYAIMGFAHNQQQHVISVQLMTLSRIRGMSDEHECEHFYAPVAIYTVKLD
jgi:hypothetical protein